MLKRFFFFIITAFIWALSIKIYYDKEISPGKVFTSPYREFLPPDLVLKDDWFGIYFNQNKIGYANFTRGLDDVDARAGYKIQAEAFLILPVLGLDERVWLQIESHIDPEYELKDFYFLFLSGQTKVEIRGKKLMDKEYELKYCYADKSSKTTITLPEGVVFSDFFGPPKEVIRPQPGKVVKFFTFNPLTLTAEEVYLQVVKKENLEICDKIHSCYLIKVNFSNLESKAWVDEDGRLLKEESPLGLIIIRESQNEVLSFLTRQRKSDFDIAEFFSLPSNLDLQPLIINKLYVVLRGKNLNLESLANKRQIILDKEFDNDITKVSLLINKESKEEIVSSLDEYLKSNSFIQSEDPKIKAIAEYLTRNEGNEVSKVKSILAWVYSYLEKKPTLSIPSALTALNLRQGDCNEHTFLFTALTRNIGIATKIKNGLVYINGRFYYHTWPSVYIDKKWIDVDPTLNQFPADPTHIMLIEGELAEQLDILKILGKIEIEVKKFE